MEEKQNKPYHVYSQYLKGKYGEKVYKLPINLPITCPNRDGTLGGGGCIFCGEVGAGFENLPATLSVMAQIQKNMNYIGQKYNARKFIAYFQNFTNTYLPLVEFKEYIMQACQPGVVEISISTRPDCINDHYLEFLNKVKEERKLEISIELGLQTVNYHTLTKINRGHTLAEFIDAVLRIKKFGFETCAHLILNLPWDNMEDVVENAKILSTLGINQIKLHSLYIVKGTVMGEMYEKGEINMISLNEYIDRVITFLEYLSPDMVIQRLIGRAPEENTLFVNWNTSWWKIRDMIEVEMQQRKSYQGKRFDYLNGKAVKKYANERAEIRPFH